MLAIDCKFVIRDRFGERYSSSRILLPPRSSPAINKEFSGDKQRVAQGTVGYGKLCWTTVGIGQAEKIPPQCDCFWDGLAQQAGIPGDPVGREAVRRSKKLVRQLFSSQGALLDP